MQQITVNTYNFDELGQEAQKTALESFRDINVDSDGWSEDVIENFKNKLEALGYENITVYYSGFWSQGDGACFIGRVDLTKWLKAHKLANKYRALYNDTEAYSINITHQSHYYHATSTTVEDGYYSSGKSEKSEKQFAEVVGLIEAEREELGNALYKELEQEYDFLTSDEVIKDTILVNEYQFLADGKRSYYV